MTRRFKGTRSDKLQSALFRITEISQSARDLDDVYASIHKVVDELMDATNFFIALRDEKSDGIWFPYYVDQFDPKPLDAVPIEGLTGHLFETGKPLLVDADGVRKMVADGVFEDIGAPSVDWMGVPLKSGERTYGVIGIQSYDETIRYSQRDLDILVFVSRHISAAIESRRKEVALQKSEEKYRSIVTYAPVGIYQSSLDGRMLTANGALARILGYGSPEELMAKNMASDIYFEPAERSQLLERFLPSGRAYDCEVRWKKKDGSPIWIQLNSHAVRGASGEILYFEGFVNEISSRKEAEEIMRTQSVAMEASMDGIGILNAEGRITYANQAFLHLFGCHSDRDLIGYHWRFLVDRKEFSRLLRNVVIPFQRSGEYRGESMGRAIHGASFPIDVSLARIASGGIVAIVRDITERNFAEEQIRHLAYHDALTGLPNRLLFRDRLNVAIPQSLRANRRLAVLFLDLDRFKVINDTLGHNAGDQLLQNVAVRLRECIRESDTVARLGGDEFTLLLPMLADSDDAARLAIKILESIREPFSIEGREIFATTSIGVSVYPDDGTDSGTLIRNADTAMYQAKESGRNNYQLFNAELNARTLERLALENDLRRAIAAREFIVHFQPIISLRTGRVSGMEALVRWQHPHLGILSPGMFIPIAEAAGMMHTIGEFVLETAARQAVDWARRGFTGLALSVNLSARQLQDVDLDRKVMRILERTGLPPSSLTLEITESTAMQNPDLSARVLDSLKRLGIRIAVDDFGIGHSSLGYLKLFPIDTLKVDQSFVHDISDDDDTASIVTGIIALAHKLRLNVIAEGVETDAQRSFLRDQECDHVQGFLFNPALPSAEFEAYLRRSNEKSGQWGKNVGKE